MASIYSIVSDCKCLEYLIGEETDPETGELREISDEEKTAFLEWINENEQALENKFNGIYKALKNKQAEAKIAEAEKDAMKSEMDRLGKRAKARENEAARIKGLFAYAMEKLKMRKYKTALFTIGWQATKKSAKPIEGFFNIDDIPAEFLKRELSPTAINKAIEEGRLYEKSNPMDKGRLFYRDEKGEQILKGVSYTGGEALVLR
jgi:hypothetical protein